MHHCVHAEKRAKSHCNCIDLVEKSHCNCIDLKGLRGPVGDGGENFL